MSYIDGLHVPDRKIECLRMWLFVALRLHMYVAIKSHNLHYSTGEFLSR